jgi:hypothetical protein
VGPRFVDQRVPVRFVSAHQHERFPPQVEAAGRS